ncbi:dihydrofolate reductase family protein [Mucilaginibacter antarcticus]|uniref:dihydrofolate reductase family protein n=1 Tax=Mucilaginibacter antarcticus TaxID=1855725 RepID=UPI0036257F1B
MDSPARRRADESAIGQNNGTAIRPLLGHFTFNIWASYWPNQQGTIAEQFNKVTKYVVSGSQVELSWENSVLITGDIITEIKNLKAQNGVDLLIMGSGKLVQALLAANLVDKLHTFTYPIILGGGKRLFEAGSQAYEWQLTDSLISATGIIMATYQPKGDVRTGQVSED